MVGIVSDSHVCKEARLRVAAKGSSGGIATQRSPPTCRATDGSCRVDRTSCGLIGNVRLIGPFAANNNKPPLGPPAGVKL